MRFLCCDRTMMTHEMHLLHVLKARLQTLTKKIVSAGRMFQLQLAVEDLAGSFERVHMLWGTRCRGCCDIDEGTGVRTSLQLAIFSAGVCPRITQANKGKRKHCTVQQQISNKQKFTRARHILLQFKGLLKMGHACRRCSTADDITSSRQRPSWL